MNAHFVESLRRGRDAARRTPGAGAAALATGLVEVAWILGELRHRCPGTEAHLDWSQFADAGRGLFLWEAFVSADAKAATHVDDATIAVHTFRKALPDPNGGVLGRTRPFRLAQHADQHRSKDLVLLAVD
jgi:hypothetical protein